MSLAHAILGFLNDCPLTGYDLKTQRFDTSVGYFWTADQAQIYRTLEKLSDQGMIESTIEYQDSRPNRKVYSITAQGRAELEAWLRTGLPPIPLREPHLIQLFFGAQLGNDEIITLLRQQLVHHQAILAAYEGIPLPAFDDPQITRETMFQRFTLEYGLRFEKMYIEWINACIERLSESSLRHNQPESLES